MGKPLAQLFSGTRQSWVVARVGKGVQHDDAGERCQDRRDLEGRCDPDKLDQEATGRSTEEAQQTTRRTPLSSKALSRVG